jgi:hypothetical protein
MYIYTIVVTIVDHRLIITNNQKNQLFLISGVAIMDSTDLVWFGIMVLNATFNNISVKSRRSVLLMEETGVPGENYH